MKRLALGILGLVIVTPVWGQSADDKKATIAYLQKLQNKDGGFSPAVGQDQSSLRATSSALRALKYFGGAVKEADACAAFVRSCFDKETGGYADRPGGKPDVIVTAVGVMAAVEVKAPADPYVNRGIGYLADKAKTFEEIRLAAAALESAGKQIPQGKAWLDQINKTRNADGTYGKGEGMARATGGAVAAVLRLGGKVERPDAVLKALKGGQRSDGGYAKEEATSSDLETTYRVLRTFHMMKDKPDAERVRGFIAKCRNEDGGYGVAPKQPSSASGTYFAGIILHWLEER
jgi:hypothetical protein